MEEYTENRKDADAEKIAMIVSAVMHEMTDWFKQRIMEYSLADGRMDARTSSHSIGYSTFKQASARFGRCASQDIEHNNCNETYSLLAYFRRLIIGANEMTNPDVIPFFSFCNRAYDSCRNTMSKDNNAAVLSWRLLKKDSSVFTCAFVEAVSAAEDVGFNTKNYCTREGAGLFNFWRKCLLDIYSKFCRVFLDYGVIADDDPILKFERSSFNIDVDPKFQHPAPWERRSILKFKNDSVDSRIEEYIESEDIFRLTPFQTGQVRFLTSIRDFLQKEDTSINDVYMLLAVLDSFLDISSERLLQPFGCDRNAGPYISNLILHLHDIGELSIMNKERNVFMMDVASGVRLMRDSCLLDNGDSEGRTAKIKGWFLMSREIMREFNILLEKVMKSYPEISPNPQKAASVVNCYNNGTWNELLVSPMD